MNRLNKVRNKHSDPYNRVDSMQLWYSLNLVCLLYCDDFHTLLSDLKIFLTLFSLFIMSFPAPPSFRTVLPRYVNVSEENLAHFLAK
jgi:hypothetical protein